MMDGMREGRIEGGGDAREPVAISTTHPIYRGPGVLTEIERESEVAIDRMRQLEQEKKEADAVFERVSADLRAVINGCEAAASELKQSPGCEQTKPLAGAISAEPIDGGGVRG